MIIECLEKQNYYIPKTFLEIGANHPYNLSCSWYLEKALGFKGVLIEPQSKFIEVFSELRPNTVFINKALVPHKYDNKYKVLFEANIDVLSSIDEHEVEVMRQMGYKFQKNINLISTKDLERHFGERIGILIIDIESFRLQIEILREIINMRLKPFIICVETLDFSTTSKSLRHDFDELLRDMYAFEAGTYLNSIYIYRGA